MRSIRDTSTQLELEAAVQRLVAGDLTTPIDLDLARARGAEALGLGLEQVRQTFLREMTRARRLQEVSAQVAAHLDLERVLASVVSAVARLLEAQKSAVILLDEESGSRRAVAASGLSDWFLETLPGLPIGHFVLDASGDLPGAASMEPESDLRAIGDREGFRSLLVLPLVDSSPSLLGTLFVAWSETRCLDESEVELVRLFAQQAVSAIEHAQLYRELDRRAEELRSWREQVERYARELAEALQKEVETVERLRELDQLKSDFVSLVSHELGNPIAAIANYAHLLSDPAFRPPPEKQRDLARIIEREAQQLSRLVQDVLTVSRLESERLTFSFQSLWLGELVREVVEEHRAAIRGHRLEFESADRQALVSGDPLRLRQVLANLLSNAVKYSPDGGPVHVRVEIGEVTGEVWVRVRDEGIGISADDLPRLFQKFSRVERGRAATIAGTGLGLYVAQQIIQAHGGRMWAESTLGRGTTITFSLPLLQQVVSTN